jgi:hypothetical protein
MYSYGARGAGNPEIHKEFEKRLEEMEAKDLDYPSLFNVVYYLMLRGNTNRKVW